LESFSQGRKNDEEIKGRKKEETFGHQKKGF